MSTKSKSKKSSSMKQGHQSDKKPVELLIDAEGIHSVSAEAEPGPETVQKPGRTKKTKPAPSETGQTQDDAEELVVFAFRLTRAERDAIHAAAGSAKASSFVRRLSTAAARGDGEALQQILAGIKPVSQ
jgi:hypothetical protein